MRPAIGVDRDARCAQGVDVAMDRPDGYLELPGELGRGLAAARLESSRSEDTRRMTPPPRYQIVTRTVSYIRRSRRTDHHPSDSFVADGRGWQGAASGWLPSAALVAEERSISRSGRRRPAGAPRRPSPRAAHIARAFLVRGRRRVEPVRSWSDSSSSSPPSELDLEMPRDRRDGARAPPRIRPADVVGDLGEIADRGDPSLCRAHLEDAHERRRDAKQAGRTRPDVAAQKARLGRGPEDRHGPCGGPRPGSPRCSPIR